MAGHWLGEAVARNCAFKPLVESSSLSALTQYLLIKSKYQLTQACQRAGFLFNRPISFFTASLVVGLHWQAGDQ
jgi:hypothetical protein